MSEERLWVCWQWLIVFIWLHELPAKLFLALFISITLVSTAATQVRPHVKRKHLSMYYRLFLQRLKYTVCLRHSLNCFRYQQIYIYIFKVWYFFLVHAGDSVWLHSLPSLTGKHPWLVVVIGTCYCIVVMGTFSCVVVVGTYSSLHDLHKGVQPKLC